MPAQFDDAICLRQWDWSETSQTGVLFCRSLGLVRVLAKGSKRQGSPYSGGLEMLTKARAGIITRPASELALLTEWDLIQTFPVLRLSLGAHYAGLYVAELIQAVVQDHDPHPRLFDAASACLESLSLDDPVVYAKALLDWQWAAILEAGYKPELMLDIVTGEALDPDATSPDSPTTPPATIITATPQAWNFLPELGGFAAPSSSSAPKPSTHTTMFKRPRENANSNDSGPIWRVRFGTLTLLRALAGESDPIAEPSLEDMDRANRLLASYLRYVLGEQPTTMTLVFAGRFLR